MMRKLWYISRFGDSPLPSPHSPRKLAIPTSNDQSRAPDMSVGHIEPTFVVYTLDGPADILPKVRASLQDVCMPNTRAMKISIERKVAVYAVFSGNAGNNTLSRSPRMRFYDTRWNRLQYLQLLIICDVWALRRRMNHDSTEELVIHKYVNIICNTVLWIKTRCKFTNQSYHCCAEK